MEDSRAVGMSGATGKLLAVQLQRHYTQLPQKTIFQWANLVAFMSGFDDKQAAFGNCISIHFTHKQRLDIEVVGILM
jgi:hypothetical protein